MSDQTDPKTADSETAGSTPHVGRGLAGLNVDRSLMSPATLALHDEYLQLASDEAPHTDGMRLQKLEHKLRGAIIGDELVRKGQEAERKAAEKQAAEQAAQEKTDPG